MKLHELKIKDEYAVAKFYGRKLFEIRENDRLFNVGDIVRYKVICEQGKEPVYKSIEEKLYEITYITDFEQKNGFVVFCEKRGRKELNYILY